MQYAILTSIFERKVDLTKLQLPRSERLQTQRLCRFTIIMAALWNWAGHYIFALWFLPSIYLSFFSSPNLSLRRLDVYHTCTHSVALVRIYDAGLKPAARGSLEMQDPKKSPKTRHLGTIP